MSCPNCSALRGRVAQLERELAHRYDQSEIAAIVDAFDLGVVGARLIAMLYRAKGRWVSSVEIMARTGYAKDNDVRVLVKRTRARVGEGFIENAYGMGYRLTPAGAASVLAAIQPVVIQPVRGAAAP